MKIYLACTVRGDRSAVACTRALADALDAMGHTILTRHLLADDPDADEASLTERAVFERDVQLLESADALVAEASGSSYGVGFEVGYAIGRSAATGQRVLLLYDAARRDKVSRLIIGNTHPACTTYPYRDADDLVRFVTVWFADRPTC